MKRIKMPLTSRRRLLKAVFIFFIATACLLFVAGGILSHYFAQKIEDRIRAAGGSAASVNINIFSRQISISDFNISPGLTPLEARLENITLRHISLYHLLINKKIEIREVSVTNGIVQFNRKESHLNDRQKSPSHPSPIKKIFVSQLSLKNINTTIRKDSLIQCSGIVNVTLNSVQSSDTTGIDDIKAYRIKDLEGSIRRLQFNSSKGFYQTRIGSVHLAGSKEKLVLDSLLLSPNYPKYKFARVAQKQIDRINLFISNVDISGFQYDQIFDSVFVASKIQIKSPEIFSFRDKRMAFKETENKPLPMAAIKRLGFGVEIDTLTIKDGKITYEEFPPEGAKSGTVTFEDLQATLSNVSDQLYQNKPAYATLEASAKLMGRGLIQATFLLPLDSRKPYHAKGQISQMQLHYLNPALENLAFIRIESGNLNNLNFNFDYDDKSSNGSLTINYQDLKITGLKKESSREESDVKTFLINTIVKNDKDKEVPPDKRTGAIEFERDRKRQIFNFWWKSLLSGIKASVLNAEKDSRKSRNSRK